MRTTGSARTGVVIVVALIAIVVAAAFVMRATDEGPHLAWHDDGSVGLITHEDGEVIHLTKEQLGTVFGPGKQPFAGKRITITVNSAGPKGG